MNASNPDACRVLAIANQKGGVGKTTTAINLATALAQGSCRTLLIDLDPQGNASTGLGSDASERAETSYDAVSGAKPIRAAITGTAIDGLSIVPASINLAGLDAELADSPDRLFRLRDLVSAEHLKELFDFIIIDCPPSLNLLTVNALAASDAVIVPLQCEFFALEGLTQLLTTIRQIQKGLNASLRIEGIVLTMYDQRNRLSAQVAEDARENLGDVIYQTIIPRNVRLSEAPSHSLPALIYDPSCAGSRAYRQLADEVKARSGRRMTTREVQDGAKA